MGKNGVDLWHYALGDDFSPVVTPCENDKPKSIGRSVTGRKDYCNNNDVWKEFLNISEEICSVLHKKNLYAAGVQVHIRTSSLSVKEFSLTYPDMINSSLIFAKRGFDLFLRNYTFGEPLRSVGLRAINLKLPDETAVQQDIFGLSEEIQEIEKVENSVFELRQKFGNDSIKRGTTI